MNTRLHHIGGHVVAPRESWIWDATIMAVAQSRAHAISATWGSRCLIQSTWRINKTKKGFNLSCGQNPRSYNCRSAETAEVKRGFLDGSGAYSRLDIIYVHHEHQLQLNPLYSETINILNST
jgi:hypothetical protein